MKFFGNLKKKKRKRIIEAHIFVSSIKFKFKRRTKRKVAETKATRVADFMNFAMKINTINNRDICITSDQSFENKESNAL